MPMDYTITIKDFDPTNAGKAQVGLVITDNETGRSRGDVRFPEQILDWLLARHREIDCLRQMQVGWSHGVPVPPLEAAPVKCDHPDVVGRGTKIPPLDVDPLDAAIGDVWGTTKIPPLVPEEQAECDHPDVALDFNENRFKCYHCGVYAEP